MSKRRLSGLALWVGLLALGVLSAACEPKPETAVQFIGQCSRAGTINLFIDSGQVGSIGGTSSSQAFPVSEGSHSLSARGGTFVWNPRTVSVPEGQTFRYTLSC